MGSNHISDSGNVQMVHVGMKAVTKRTAMAEGRVVLPHAPGSKDKEWQSPKGPVFQTAIIAGIQAAKRCSELIPLCHSLPLEACDISINWENEHSIVVRSTISCTGKTGVEMEALTAVSIACLTIYDMGKSMFTGIEIQDIYLLEKHGGKSTYVRKH